LTACCTPSLWAAHCLHRCFSIFLPFLISVRWTVAGLLQLSHFNCAFLQRTHCPVNQWYFGNFQASMKNHISHRAGESPKSETRSPNQCRNPNGERSSSGFVIRDLVQLIAAAIAVKKYLSIPTWMNRPT